jgi:hypothetical protein
MAMKRGSLVRAVREKMVNSLEALANDPKIPDYVFTAKGEVVEMENDYALVKFGVVPTPPIWFRVDQLEDVE